MASLLSTNSVQPRDRFAYWREAVCDSYVLLDCSCNRPEEFGGEILLNRMSRLSTSFVSGSKQLVQRRKKDISRSDEECFLISLQLEKTGVVSQCGREAYLQPGDFALYSSTDRYSIDIPDAFRQLVVQIPREELLARLPKADVLTGRCVSGKDTLGSVVCDSVLRLVGTLDQAGETVRHSMQDTIIDLFVTGLASMDDFGFELSKPEQQILLRADAAIRSNLHRPSFDRTALASIMGISVRRLSEIYQADNRSIASTIREMRLNNIAKELGDSRNARLTINDIAFRFGFESQQRLIRSFKAYFGVTPREYRQQVLVNRN